MRLVIALGLWLASIASVQAHKPSDSFLALAANGSALTGTWSIAIRDLEAAIGVDANGDGSVTWGELRAAREAIARYSLGRLVVRQGSEPCRSATGGMAVDRLSDGAYVVLDLTIDCPQAVTTVDVDYRLFFDVDARHRGMMRISVGEETVQAVFAKESARQTISARPSTTAIISTYLREGLWHIWTGFDHLLFLLALLVGAVLIRPQVHDPDTRRLRAVERFGPVAVQVAKVVTAFTLAHSLTLALAATGWVSLPSRWVESVIAASVIVAALANLAKNQAVGTTTLAFAFGLIHGFGFAGALADLGLPTGAFALSLAAFNIGVEIGQLAIVAVLLPLAFLSRRTAFYQRGVVTAGSCLVAAIAAVWLAERAFDFKLLPV